MPRRGKRRRQMQQEQIERRDVPQRRKAAEMIVGGLHAPIGEIERARHHDADAEQRRRQRQQQPARGDRIGRHEHIGDEIDHEIEHLARPVRLQPHDIELPRDRAVDRIDDQRHPEPGEHGGPVLAHGLQHRDQRDARAQRREDMHGECGGPRSRLDAAGRNLAGSSGPLLRQCYQESPLICISALAAFRRANRMETFRQVDGLKMPPGTSIVPI